MKDMTKKQAKLFLNSFLNLREGATDVAALTAVYTYPTWEVGTNYKTGDRVLHNDTLYKVLQNHTSQDNWTPDTTPSLFAKVLITDANVIPEWVQPDSTNPYMIGDKVTCEGKTWQSIVDNNIWKPGVYGWECLSGAGSVI